VIISIIFDFLTFGKSLFFLEPFVAAGAKEAFLIEKKRLHLGADV